ncbi:hypothetical protein GF324_02750 [bacterium]|nr:hypothetical protein [bacterium]
MQLVPDPDNPRPEPYDKEGILRSEHLDTSYRGRKTTQGLFYASYGMDEKSRGQRRQRYYLPRGAKWTLRFLAKDTDRKWENGTMTLTAAEAMAQAQAALWLLCNYGAVGSKSRHGFGSLSMQVKNGNTNNNLLYTVEDD